MPLVIDPQSIFVIGMLLMLANGGILGVVHREILPQLQSSALVWRRGTLLLAGACVFFASINKIPVRLGLLSADALLLAGTTCYWYALRQFFHRRPHWRIHLPALLGIAATSMFFARLGARLAHHLPAHILKRLFALLLLGVGLNFLL